MATLLVVGVEWGESWTMMLVGWLVGWFRWVEFVGEMRNVEWVWSWT